MKWLLLLLLATPALAAEEPVEAHPAIAQLVLKPPAGVENLALTLARLQDAAAAGNGGSNAMQRRLLVELSKGFRAHDPHTLPSPRTLRAAIIYLLSGGRPGDAEALLSATPETEPLRWILKGAALYAANDRQAAARVFAPFKPEHLAHSIGGRVALARAAGLTEAEAAEKIRLLRLAASLMPGTLVEESALRRLLAIAASLGDPLPLQQMMERYVERFGNSIYADGVVAQYALAVVAFEARGKPVPRPAMERMLNRLGSNIRGDTYLAMAQGAVPRGLADLALFSATRARRLADEGSSRWHRATLYDAAILITGPDHVIGLDLLAQVDAAKLDTNEGAFLKAALRLAAAIRKPEGLPPAHSDPPQMSDAQAQLLSKAQTLLFATDGILKGVSQ
jgi:chemotaxis protein MotC